MGALSERDASATTAEPRRAHPAPGSRGIPRTHTTQAPPHTDIRYIAIHYAPLVQLHPWYYEVQYASSVRAMSQRDPSRTRRGASPRPPQIHHHIEPVRSQVVLLLEHAEHSL